MSEELFVILQKYDFSSKSQRLSWIDCTAIRCLWYCKSTIFQANHNSHFLSAPPSWVVCDTAKVRFFKQITTFSPMPLLCVGLFVILQKYDFSSKSQPKLPPLPTSTVVCDTAKVRFFKQITTVPKRRAWGSCCLWYCKSTIFQANHNWSGYELKITLLFVILQKYDFSSKSQLLSKKAEEAASCLWYCKSTIFQANHNPLAAAPPPTRVVCDTAKVRFFKQITTTRTAGPSARWLFVILQKYDFSSKSQQHL